MKFLQIKEGGSNIWDEPILQSVWIIWSPLLYFNLKSFSDPSSRSFNRFQSILYDSGVPFSGFSNFYKLKRGDLISVGEPIFQNLWIIWSPFLYLNLKSPMKPNSSSFIRYQSILKESGRLFWESINFYELKMGDLIGGGTNFAECLNYLVPPSLFQF